MTTPNPNKPLPHHLPTIEEIGSVIDSDSHEGYCTYCGDWTHDGCEPDAHHYTCPVCENRTCYGAEELIMQNLFR